MRGLIFQLAIFTFCCTGFAANAQTGGADTGFIYKAMGKLSDLTAREPTEKVYLHLDKPYYAAGDDIWFKAYLVSGNEHRLSALSGVLNVELVDEKGTRIQAIKLPVKFGLSAGDFHLPYATPSGKYHIIAFTNYQLNWGGDYFFDQAVMISGVDDGKKSPGKSPKPANAAAAQSTGVTIASLADVQFLPESGSLVSGISSRIAFKAVDANGKGIAVKGLVLDNKGVEITNFNTQHLGMGSFELSPLAGAGYSAKITFDDGSQKTVSLPGAASSGYVLRMANLKNNGYLLFEVSYAANTPTGKPADSSLVLMGQCGGAICYAANLKLRGGSISGRIPKDKLPTGVSQFSLFTKSGEPVCERLIFINNNDQLNITLTDSNQVSLAHQLNTIKLQSQGAENKSSIGSFSVSVIDDAAVPGNDLAGTENILSYLLLTSDVKGKIENPGYYFDNNNEVAAADLDLLMLTQGYRHFEWKKVLNSPLPPLTYAPQKQITVSGQLLTLAGKPLASANVTLFGRQSGLLRDTITSEHGDFTFSNMLFTDSITVLLTGKTKDGRNNLQIKLDEVHNSAAYFQVADAPKKRGGASTFMADTIPAAYRRRADEKFNKYPTNGEVLLQEVDIKATAKPKVSESSSNLNGAGNADQIMTSKDLEALAGMDLCQVLGSGKLLGVNVINGKLVSNRSTGSRGMLIVLDGAYYTGDLCALNSANIESVEVLINPGYTAIYGGRGSNGVAVITSKRGGAYYQPPGNAATFTIKGYYKAREFYSPKNEDNGVNSTLADLRSTIYWNPNIVTDKNGNASFSYFNSGAKSTYIVIVQGMDLNGKLGYRLFKYKVE